VARYAEATRVSVILAAKNSDLILSVRDDGRGFDTKALAESEGIGIAGMRERASLAGGTLEVNSEPEKGCHVQFRVPIDFDSKES
jgi:signal transduction histidine kinase